MSKFRELVENLDDIKQWLSQSSKNKTEEANDKIIRNQDIGFFVNGKFVPMFHAGPDGYLKSLKGQEDKKKQVKEGDKKVFDKETGYNSSKDETYIFDKLKEKYPNIIISYTDDRFVNPETHRHFQLDFYDPDSDTGFNYNKTWTHCRRKYDPTDPNCQADVKWLESQDGDYYDRALKQWTITDPIKREVAKANGLKFIEWFNLDEFNRWFENPELTYDEYKYAPDSVQYDSEEYFKQKARGRDIYGVDSDPYAD